MSLAAFKTIFWWEWTHRLIGRLIGVVFLVPLLWFLWRGWVGPDCAPAVVDFRARRAAGRRRLVDGRLRARSPRRSLAVSPGDAPCSRLRDLRRDFVDRAADSIEPREPAPARIRFSAVGLLVLVLAQIYLGALVAGLRAGYVYNTWPLIDGALVPGTSRLFFNTPLWRNFFENTLTVQFDHRMLAYTIWICAALHAFDACAHRGEGAGARRRPGAVRRRDVAGRARHLDPADGGAAVAFIGHQAMAMLVLTAAIVHAAFASRPVLRPRSARPA